VAVYPKRQNVQVKIGDSVVNKFSELDFPAEVRKDDGDQIWIRIESKHVLGAIHKHEVCTAKEAIEIFSEKITTAPDDTFALLMRASAWHELKKFEKASADIDEYIRLKPGATGYECKSRISASQGDLNQTISDCTEAIRHDPSLAWTYNNRGTAWGQSGNLTHALEDLTEAIRLDPNCATAYNNRGPIWQQKGKLDKAVQDFSEAIRLDPTFSSPYNNRGIIWLMSGSVDKAKEDFDSAICFNPGFANPYNNRGYFWLRKGMFQTAIPDFDNAIRLNPNYVDAHYNRAVTWAKLGHWKKVVADCSRTLQIDPKHAESYCLRGIAFQKTGRWKEAVSELDATIKVNPKSEAAYRTRARIKATCPDDRFRNASQAVADATTACELGLWKNVESIDTLAAAHAEAQQFDVAVRVQTRVLSILPNDPQAKLRLALYREGKPCREAPELSTD
jgi:tetratricopeptide (TPR) repeat protein